MQPNHPYSSFAIRPGRHQLPTVSSPISAGSNGVDVLLKAATVIDQNSSTTDINHQNFLQQVHTFRNEMIRYQTACRHLDHQYEDLKAEMTAVEASNLSLREALDKRRNDALDLENRWYSVVDQTQAVYVELAEMKDRFQQEVADPKREVETLRRLVLEKQREINKSQGEAYEKQRELADLEEDLCETDGEFRKLKGANGELTKQIAVLTEKLRAVESVADAG